MIETKYIEKEYGSFYEKQNWITEHNRTSKKRLDEKIIKKITVCNKQKDL